MPAVEELCKACGLVEARRHGDLCYLCAQHEGRLGHCVKCGADKPVDQFSPRVAREPFWYPHHARCKACVNEQAKVSIRRRAFEVFMQKLPGRSTVNLESEAQWLAQKLTAIHVELKRRGTV